MSLQLVLRQALVGALRHMPWDDLLCLLLLNRPLNLVVNLLFHATLAYSECNANSSALFSAPHLPGRISPRILSTCELEIVWTLEFAEVANPIILIIEKPISVPTIAGLRGNYYKVRLCVDKQQEEKHMLELAILSPFREGGGFVAYCSITSTPFSIHCLTSRRSEFFVGYRNYHNDISF
jgi:hypothetical protein